MRSFIDCWAIFRHILLTCLSENHCCIVSFEFFLFTLAVWIFQGSSQCASDLLGLVFSNHNPLPFWVLLYRELLIKRSCTKGTLSNDSQYVKLPLLRQYPTRLLAVKLRAMKSCCCNSKTANSCCITRSYHSVRGYQLTGCISSIFRSLSGGFLSI